MKISKKISYGNVTFWQGPNSPETKAFKWTTFVRDAYKEDLSFIKKVTFTLHPSFINPIQTIESPPFEITEYGWGEFEIKIIIHFVDPLEKSVEIMHGLKLFHDDGKLRNEPVISQTFDEIVFVNPREKLMKALYNQNLKFKPLTIEDAFKEKPPQEVDEIEIILKAQKNIDQEIQKLKERMERAIQQSVALKQEMN